MIWNQVLKYHYPNISKYIFKVNIESYIHSLIQQNIQSLHVPDTVKGAGEIADRKEIWSLLWWTLKLDKLVEENRQ